MDRIKIENHKVLNMQAAIQAIGIELDSERGSASICRNKCNDCVYREFDCVDVFIIGETDMKEIAKRIRHGQDKFLRQILISFDLSAPTYFWNEYDSINPGGEEISIPTKDILEKNELTIKNNFFVGLNPSDRVLQCLSDTIKGVNKAMKLYEDTNNRLYLEEAVKMLPESFVRKRTVLMNYESAMKILKAGRFSLFDEEWDVFIDFIESIPYIDCFMEAKYGDR